MAGKLKELAVENESAGPKGGSTTHLDFRHIDGPASADR